MMNKEVFKLIQNCIPVRGINQSLICDLHRKTYHTIPNDLYTILTNHEGKTIQEIKDSYNHEYDTIIDEYFEFLLEKEYIFYTNTPDLFPEMNMQFHYPFEISNAIIDRNNQSKYDFYNAIDQLALLKCKFLEIRFFDTVSISEIEKLFTYLNNSKSIIVSVGILLPFSISFEEHQNKLLTKFARLSYLILHGAEQGKVISSAPDNKGHIIHTKDKITSEKCCGVINTSYFASNIRSFTESLQHNSCLNKKIAIDANGNIKNCPSMAQSFGNIKDTTLEEALYHKDFKKYWNISKDQITICKACEFRYICTDCRAYLTNPKDDYSKPLKCGYDPYTNVWEEWSTHPLKQKAIDFYKMRSII